MTAHSHEQGPRDFGATRWLTRTGDRLLDNRQELSGRFTHVAAIIAAMVEGAGHVVGVTGRAVARTLRSKEH